MAKAFLREHGSQILEQRDEAINSLFKRLLFIIAFKFGMTPYLSCVTSGSWELIEWM